MNAAPWLATLTALSRHRGVLGTLLVSERDGLAVESMVQIGVNAETVAALAASLHRKARLASAAAGYGGVHFVRLDAERGHVLAAGRGDLLFVVISELRANTGLLRVELTRAAEALT